MPLPLTVSCFSKIQICFTFLVPAHPGSPGQRAFKWVCVCVCYSCHALKFIMLTFFNVFIILVILYYIIFFIVNKYTGTSMQSDQKFTRPVCHMQPTMHIAQCCTALQLPRNISTNVKLK